MQGISIGFFSRSDSSSEDNQRAVQSVLSSSKASQSPLYMWKRTKLGVYNGSL